MRKAKAAEGCAGNACASATVMRSNSTRKPENAKTGRRTRKRENRKNGTLIHTMIYGEGYRRWRVKSATWTLKRNLLEGSLPYNIAKMAPNFRGRLDLGGFSQIFSTWRNIQSDKKRKLSLFLNKLYREQSKAEKPFVGNVFRKSVLLISSPRKLEWSSIFALCTETSM